MSFGVQDGRSGARGGSIVVSLAGAAPILDSLNSVGAILDCLLTRHPAGWINHRYDRFDHMLTAHMSP
jgi:hypothetical protein